VEHPVKHKIPKNKIIFFMPVFSTKKIIYISSELVAKVLDSPEQLGNTVAQVGSNRQYVVKEVEEPELPRVVGLPLGGLPSHTLINHQQPQVLPNIQHIHHATFHHHGNRHAILHEHMRKWNLIPLEQLQVSFSYHSPYLRFLASTNVFGGPSLFLS
jgi:hypothetical protein